MKKYATQQRLLAYPWRQVPFSMISKFCPSLKLGFKTVSSPKNHFSNVAKVSFGIADAMLQDTYMTYKDTMTMDKAWTHAETSGIPFAGLFMKLKNAISVKIPVGYQDETGFHFGIKPDQDHHNWPTTW